MYFHSAVFSCQMYCKEYLMLFVSGIKSTHSLLIHAFINLSFIHSTISSFLFLFLFFGCATEQEITTSKLYFYILLYHMCSRTQCGPTEDSACRAYGCTHILVIVVLDILYLNPAGAEFQELQKCSGDTLLLEGLPKRCSTCVDVSFVM